MPDSSNKITNWSKYRRKAIRTWHLWGAVLRFIAVPTRLPCSRVPPWIQSNLRAWQVIKNWPLEANVKVRGPASVATSKRARVPPKTPNRSRTHAQSPHPAKTAWCSRIRCSCSPRLPQPSWSTHQRTTRGATSRGSSWKWAIAALSRTCWRQAEPTRWAQTRAGTSASDKISLEAKSSANRRAKRRIVRIRSPKKTITIVEATLSPAVIMVKSLAIWGRSNWKPMKGPNPRSRLTCRMA